MTDNVAKPPRDWQPPPRICEEAPAYIEYTVDRDGDVKVLCFALFDDVFLTLAMCREFALAEVR